MAGAGAGRADVARVGPSMPGWTTADPLFLSHLSFRRLVAVGSLTLSVAVASATFATWTATPAGAQTDLSQLRAEAEAATRRIVETYARYQDLGDKIEAIESQLPALELRLIRLRSDAAERAVAAYIRAGTAGLDHLQTGHVLRAQRRNRLLDGVNARDAASMRALRVATDELASERTALRDARHSVEDALASLRAQDAALQAKVVVAEREAAARVAATSTTKPTVSPSTTVTTSPPTTNPPAGGGGGTGGGTSGTPGVHPRHADPFLVCLRQHESDGTDVNHNGLYDGGYHAVNPAGPFLGAYQFLQSTWNSTASHMGRPGLIGTPPQTATPYDQDDVAWALYQWLGAGPWGNLCVSS